MPYSIMLDAGHGGRDPVIRTYFFFIVFVPFKIIDCQRTVYQEKLRGANEEKLNVVIVLYLDYGCAKIYK